MVGSYPYPNYNMSQGGVDCYRTVDWAPGSMIPGIIPEPSKYRLDVEALSAPASPVRRHISDEQQIEAASWRNQDMHLGPKPTISPMIMLPPNGVTNDRPSRFRFDAQLLIDAEAPLSNIGGSPQKRLSRS